MPKYAANLGAAPLQPQKSTSSSVLSPNEDVPNEKSTSKSTPWVDPVEGQQCKYIICIMT